MSADGKIADFNRSPARFGSSRDRSHLETLIAEADGVLFGAGTLRAYGTTLLIKSSSLLQKRQCQGKPAQPVHIVCSRSAALAPELKFFQQPVPRWLLTSSESQANWQERPEFAQVLSFYCEASGSGKLSWLNTLADLRDLGIERLAVTGGGELVASLFEANLVDELWLTICPLILGGATAPTPVAGAGFVEKLAPRLTLVSAEVVDQEVFLHYCRQGSDPRPS
jgi:5-amino-6-(5-phosphoribosylamino)uracil reductase